MKIEISIGFDRTIRIPDMDDGYNVWYVEDTETIYEHDGYYDSIDEAIEALQRLKEQEEPAVRPRCDKCVYLKETCGQTDKDGKCWKYKRDPPDGGYYG